MKKKNLWLLLLTVILGMLLVACGSDSSSKGDSGKKSDDKVSGEILVWVQPYSGDAQKEEDMWKQIIANFNKEYPDVKVKIETIPWANRDQKILTALAANNGPDVFYAIPDQMPQYADVGMLLELDPYLTEKDMDGFVDTALIATKWKGKTYGLPILQEAYTLIYNVDIIKAIGEDPNNLPTTWEEFEAWAKKAKEKGYYALNYLGGGPMNGTLYPWVWQAGGDILTEDGKVLINSPESVEAFEFVNKLYQNGYIPEDSITSIDQSDLWYGGKMLACIGSGIDINTLQSEGTFDYVIGPPLKYREQLTYGTTGMFVVPSNTDNPAAAAAFVKVLTNAENQRIFNTVTQYFPTREEAKDIFNDNKDLSEMAKYTDLALPGVIHPKGRTIMPYIQAEVQSMMSGEKTPQQAADASAEAIKAELAK